MKFRDIQINMIINEVDNKNSVGVIIGIARQYDRKMHTTCDNKINPILPVVKFIDEEFPRKIHSNNIEQFKG